MSRLSGAALIIAACAASIASAAPIGTLSITNTAGGGVVVSATGTDWFNPVGGGFGDFATGSPTSVTWSGGVLTSATNPYGQIKDIGPGVSAIPNFIQFYTTATQTTPNPAGTGVLQAFPVFDLTGINAGGSAQGALNNCAGVTAVGVGCSPLVTVGGNSFVSPFVLTNRGAYTDVSLGVSLLGKDASGSTPWAGGFTTQVTTQGGVRLTPDAIQTIINNGGSITNTYSATFTGAAVPEPAAMGLVGFGLVCASYLLRKRNVKA